jgi:hypothetical protein
LKQGTRATLSKIVRKIGDCFQAGKKGVIVERGPMNEKEIRATVQQQIVNKPNQNNEELIQLKRAYAKN